MILKGKAVIITGAGPGMGQAMCRGAAAEGARVAVSARSADAIAAIVADIKAAGGEAISVPTDVSDTVQCKRLAEETLKAFGRIDGLVNSAYFHPPWASLETAEIDDVARAFNVNALGGLRMAQASHGSATMPRPSISASQPDSARQRRASSAVQTSP